MARAARWGFAQRTAREQRRGGQSLVAIGEDRGQSLHAGEARGREPREQLGHVVRTAQPRVQVRPRLRAFGAGGEQVGDEHAVARGPTGSVDPAQHAVVLPGAASGLDRRQQGKTRLACGQAFEQAPEHRACRRS